MKETFLCVILVFASAEGQTPPPQRFLREPTDQTAIQGAHVTLPCRVANKKGMLQWTRDGFGLGIERNLTGFDRYRMTGSDEEGRIKVNHGLLETYSIVKKSCYKLYPCTHFGTGMVH